MDKKTEALKLAEDALKRVRTQDMALVQLSMIALAAIREALASEAIEKPAPPPECQTEAEKTAYAFGWFKALESVRKRPAEQEPMTTQTEADRLANQLDYHREYDLGVTHTGIDEQAAAELRRQQAEIERLNEALAEQPAQRQEPYGWHTEDHLTDRSATTYSKDVADRWKSKGWPVTPFYTSPPAQPSKPLRGERFVEIARAIAPRTVLGLQETIPLWIVKYGRAIEAAHGIKGDT